ncbi:hypothetical protein JCM8097_006188 [Rhodosporidiobolus ruineniae]
MPSASPIPLIDLSLHPTAEELASDILKTLSSIGFLFLRLPEDGGLSQAKVNRAFQIHKELYDSPLEERLKCARKGLDRNGYLRLQENRLAESKGEGDLKENFNFGTDAWDGTHPHELLPGPVEYARGELAEFHASCYDLVNQLLDAFSIALNLPKTYFRDKHSLGGNTLALINYPPVAGNSTGARASVHKDWGSVTLLFQEENGTPGLEVFLPDGAVEASTSDSPYQLITDTDLSRGQWHPAPVIPGTVLVNLGLALEGWTGGVLRATLHRVVLPSSGPNGEAAGRRSVPYFVNPTLDTVLNPIRPDGTIEVKPGAKTMREFLQDRIATTKEAAGVTD